MVSASRGSTSGTSTGVPVLDLASHDEVDLAARLDTGFRTWGSVVVTGHGIRTDLLSSLSNHLLEFFRLRADVKAKYASRRTGDFGWIDRSDVGGGGQWELCEVYAAGPWGEPGAPTDGMSPEAQAMTIGTNKWPDEVPRLRDLWLDYYEAAERPADLLLRLAALALSEPDDTFARHHRNPISPMIANWYPPQPSPPEPGRIRKGAHSDWGSLTLLWHDGTPGLELRDDAGTWSPLQAPIDSLIVNVGDLMARWTNGRWKAAVHRVANPTGVYTSRERISIAWFGQPDYDALVHVLASCVSPDNPARYEPVGSGDWYSSRMRNAYQFSAAGR